MSSGRWTGSLESGFAGERGQKMDSKRARTREDNISHSAGSSQFKSVALKITFWLTLVALASKASDALSREQIPKPFTDTLISLSQHQEKDLQEIDYLGKIIKLNTYWTPKRVDSLQTRFSIFRRKLAVENITFTPNSHCYPDLNSCYGPFQYNLSALSESGFDPSKRTIIMISGYLTKDRVKWMERAKDSWLELDQEANVILVTWRDANRLLYPQAVAHTPLVARQITVFLYYLAELSGYRSMDRSFLDKIHFIGHSLGAHIGGFVGKDLGGKMGRITGLDPAGPSFDLMEAKFRLDSSDAQLVDVLHTNMGKFHLLNAVAGVALSGSGKLIDLVPYLNRLTDCFAEEYTGEGDTAWLGIDAQLGHLDYYANSGRVQPNCSNLMHLCDHKRSHIIYEDILKHEIELRRSAATREQIKQNRLLAFRSNNYESFLTGANFQEFCPSVIVEDSKVDRIGQQIDHCAIPIDLVTPFGEFKEQLKQEFNLDLNIAPIASQSLDRRFFFKTSSKQPLVGDHYLLRMHLGKSSSWDSSCSLKVELKMADGSSSAIDINKELPFVRGANFHGLAMPFLNPFGAEARHAFHNILIAASANARLPVVGPIWSSLVKVMPAEVMLRIAAAESTSVLGVVATKLMRWATLGMARKASTTCRLVILSMEVHPIVGFERSLIGVYGLSGAILAGTDSAYLPVLTPSEHMKLTSQSAIVADASSSLLSHKLGAVVVGH